MKRKEISDIYPFCIYHYIDHETETYRGYIGNAAKQRTENGVDMFKCPPEPKVFGRWFLADTFYAVAPDIRPIPVGMRIFCAQKTGEFPYGTKDLHAMYDPFNMKKDCVYFITYTQPVPNTVPLYFHKIGNDVFPSFDPKPPSSNPNWTQTQISPVFVMTPDTIGDKSAATTLIKFKCVNGRCLPWVKDIPDMWDDNPHGELLTLSKCVLYCNELQIDEEGEQAGLLQRITKSKHKGTVSRFFKKLSPWMIGLVLTIFLTVFFIVIFTLIKKKNEKSKSYRG